MKLADIQKNYEKQSDYKLLEIAQNASSLRPKAIGLLKAEFEKRGLTDGLNILENNGKSVSPFDGLTLAEIQSMVSDRMMQGEPFDSIKTDLEIHDVDVKELLNQEGEKEEGISEFLLEAKKQNFDQEEINKVIKEKYNLQDEDVEHLKTKIRSRGSGYIILGTLLAVLPGLFLIISLANGRFSFKILAVVVLGIGFIIKGLSQRKV